MPAVPTNILLVDDDDINNFLSEEIITLHVPSASIVSKVSVKEALDYLYQLLEAKKNLPDIILVDINMPWLNGWDFIEGFEKMDFPGAVRPRLYIYTSSVYYKDIERGRSYQSVTNILTKPLTEQMLQEIFGNTRHPNQ